jgi:hypothetical protein
MAVRRDFADALLETTMKNFATTLTMIGCAALISACDPKPSPKAAMPPMGDQPVAGAPAQQPPAPVADPSLPPADKALSAAGKVDGNTAGGTDSKATQPMGDLTKKEESESMPKAGQANNHSSPSIEPKPASKP